MHTFELRSPMPVSARELYDWHTRPGAFERLVPPWQRVEIVAQAGDFATRRVTLRMHQGPVPVTWVAQHRDTIEGEQFVDEQVEGPFRTWVHTHRFEPGSGGDDTSVLHDQLDWDGTFAAIGGVLTGGVDATLERTFTFRHARTARDLACHARWSTRPLTIAISGARGLVGEHLIPFLTSGGHTVRRLVRGTPGPGDIRWDPARGELDAAALEGIDAFIHLSGEPISARWTDERKREIVRSRVDSTRLVASALAKLPNRPALISASAIGYYGDRGDERLTEASAPGEGFLPEVCTAWEEATAPAREAGLRVVNLRIGVVLSAEGGALGQLLRPFRMGAGGVVGTGQQGMSWIHIDDLLGLFLWSLATDVSGPVNATAPTPVSNADFTSTLGEVLHRPTIMPLPAFAVKLAFGEMGERLLLEGAYVLPEAATRGGYPFAFPTLGEALRFELEGTSIAASAKA